mgnify:CR=1 FL=1
MSLLLDALKKSEARRRRGTTPTIDLTRAEPSGRQRRHGSRWLFLVLAGLLLVAVSPWLWPQLSEWIEVRANRADDSETLAAVTNTAGAESASRDEIRAENPVQKIVPAPVAGASSTRRVAADVSSTAAANTSDGNDRIAERSGDDSDKDTESAEPRSADASSHAEVGASTQEVRRTVQARASELKSTPEPQPQPESEPVGEVTDPAGNFIRPWELPQAQRAEFPALRLTVHFYTERAADRFVLIDGERYTEGQRIAPDTILADITKDGAVVEFGSYRVLIQ